MKQASVKLPSGEYLIIRIHDNRATNIEYVGAFGVLWYQLPVIRGKTAIEIEQPGTWQLLGADPTNLTEEEAGEIIGEWNSQYKDYTYTSDHGETYYPFDLPTASLNSLAASLGISKPYVVLKNVEK